jgi:hypothetical protein
MGKFGRGRKSLSAETFYRNKGMSTYGGITRELPILPYNIGSASMLVRGMVLQWNPALQIAMAWVSGGAAPLGVATSDPDRDIWQIDAYVGKGASVLIKLADGIVPGVNDFLYYSAPGVVSNNANGPAFARAIGVPLDGFVEAIIC